MNCQPAKSKRELKICDCTVSFYLPIWPLNLKLFPFIGGTDLLSTATNSIFIYNCETEEWRIAEETLSTRGDQG